MALYKARGLAPQTGSRIEGFVWSSPGPGSTIRGWVYPTAHYSAQFSRFNSLVRNAQDTWDEMSPGQQDAWNHGHMPWPPPGWWLWCWFFPVYPYSAWDGREAFIVLQCWAALCGVVGPINIPLPAWNPAVDGFAHLPGHGMLVYWARTGFVYPQPTYMAVFARAKLSSQNAAGSHQAQSFVGVLPCVPGVPVDVGPMCLAAGVAGPGIETRLLLCVGEYGIYPLAAGWLSVGWTA